MSLSKIFVITGPSGAGKTTLVNHIIERGGIGKVVTYTTRPPRVGEKNGEDYYFISRPYFEKKRKAGDFAEWSTIYGNYYGNSAADIENVLMDEEKSVVIILDVQGAKAIKKIFPEAVLIFVRTADIETLRHRMKMQRKDSIEVIERRMLEAEKEIKAQEMFDYILINDNLDQAKIDIISIIDKELS